MFFPTYHCRYTIGVSPSLATVSRVVEDLKIKISYGSDKKWCFPDSAHLAVSAKLRQLTGQGQENTNFGHSLLKF